MKATHFMAMYRSIPSEPKVSTDEALLAPQSASGKPQTGPAQQDAAVTKSGDSRERPAIHSCVRCGVYFETAEDLDEHELTGCDLEDLMENAARNADDQIGTYG